MPAKTAQRLRLESFVPYRLSVLTNRMSNEIARHYSDRFGLSIPEWRVIAVSGPGREFVRAAGGRTHRDGQGAGQPRGTVAAGRWAHRTLGRRRRMPG